MEVDVELLGRCWKGMYIPVLDPSSMMRHEICPSLRISPVFAGTKLMGRRGIFIVEIAFRASSSMVATRLQVGN